MKGKAGSKIKLMMIKCLVVLASTLLLISCTPMGGHVNEDISDNHYYNLFHTEIIFGSMGNCWNIGCKDIYGADVSTFEPLNGVYAVDNDNVYYKEKHIRLEKPKYFKLLEGSFAKGKRGIYCKGKIITKNSPESFTILNVQNDDRHYTFGIGKKHVYDDYGRIISDTPDSFHHIGHSFFADNTEVYSWTGFRVKAIIDAASFKFLKSKSGSLSHYAKDKNNVFSMVVHEDKIKDVDYDSFEVICTGNDYPELAKDKNHVYGYERILEGLNPNDFNYPETCEKYKGRAHIDRDW